MDYRQVPNALTVLRLVLAGAFFCVLNGYRYGPPGSEALSPPGSSSPWLLGVACLLFIAAAMTDALDGHLARRWKVESLFGRIVDPFADKVLVLGAVIYLAGPQFLDPLAVEQGRWATQVSGVYPWMVVVVLARELLVTSIRGAAEGLGVEFGAKKLGKWKMILQSVVVPAVLGIVAIDVARPGWEWLTWLRDGLVWATVLVTVLSGLPYVTAAGKLMRAEGR